jgi:hypothetical protein
MFIIDAARSVPRQAMFQRIGLANPSERGTLDVPDQGIDALEHLPVRALPMQIILPSVRGLRLGASSTGPG